MNYDTLNVSPNAGKFIESNRRNGMNNEDCLFDLLDNCVDADANEVYLSFIFETLPIKNSNKKRKQLNSIELIDNGHGMTYKELNEALKLGSETDKHIKSNQRGIYGVGLNNACGSLGSRYEIWTKTEKMATPCYASYDLELIKEKNAFVANGLKSVSFSDLGSSINDKTLETVSSSSFTIIKISNVDGLIDDWTLRTTKKLYELSHLLGRKFHRFIDNRVCSFTLRSIFKKKVDEIVVESVSPINGYPHQELGSGWVSIYDPETNKLVEDVYVNAVYSNQGNLTDLRGTYYIRNDREIAREQAYKFTGGGKTHHSSNNYWRCEISYTEKSDHIFQTSNTKKFLTIHESIREQLLKKCIGDARKNYNKIYDDADQRKKNKEVREKQKAERLKKKSDDFSEVIKDDSVNDRVEDVNNVQKNVSIHSSDRKQIIKELTKFTITLKCSNCNGELVKSAVINDGKVNFNCLSCETENSLEII
jgi:hypothetical protein